MRFPLTANHDICAKHGCPFQVFPAEGEIRPQGYCVNRRDGECYISEADPSLVVLVRDPTIEKYKPFQYVLRARIKDHKPSSQLFGMLDHFLLSRLSGNPDVYVDNYIRSPAKENGNRVTRKQLDGDYWRYSAKPA